MRLQNTFVLTADNGFIVGGFKTFKLAFVPILSSFLESEYFLSLGSTRCELNLLNMMSVLDCRLL